MAARKPTTKKKKTSRRCHPEANGLGIFKLQAENFLATRIPCLLSPGRCCTPTRSTAPTLFESNDLTFLAEACDSAGPDRAGPARVNSSEHPLTNEPIVNTT